MNKIPVTYRRDPFNLSQVETFTIEPGESLLDIVHRITDDPDYFVVCVNGTAVGRDWLARVKPKATAKVPTVVTLHPVPHGGKAGGILGILAAVAIIVGTAGIGAGALAPILGASFAAGTFGATAAAAAFGALGSLAISALTAPPIQPNAAVGGPEAKTIAGVSFNNINPGDYLPMVLGTVRVSPPPLMPSFTTYENGDVYVNGIVGLAGAYSIANIWLNGSPVELFEDLTYSTRQGLLSDAAPSMNFTYSVQEQQPRLKLSGYKLDADSIDFQDKVPPEDSYPDWHVFNLHAPGDTGKFVFRFHWPTGMNVIDDDGSLDAGAIGFLIEIRPRSQAAGTWYKLPAVIFRQKEEHNTEIRQQVTLQWGTPSSGTLGISTTQTAWAAYWKTAPGTALERTAESIYDPGGSVNTARRVTSDIDGFTIEIDNTAMDGDEEYDVRIRAGMPFKQAGFNASTTAAWQHDADTTQGAALFAHDTLNTASAVTKGGSAAGFVYLESAASFMVREPFVYSGLANIAFKAKGVEISSLSAEFTSIIPVWDGASWATVQPSNNPAALYRFALLSPDYNAQPIPGEIVDEANLVEWFAHCVAMDYECNAPVQNMALPDVLQLIASAGWASPRYSDLWGVVMERSRRDEEIIQLLTPLNSRDLGTTKEFPKMPHAIRAEYFSETDEFQLHDDVVAYAPGFDSSTATLYESIQYIGITDAEKAQIRAQFDINQIYLRATRYVREVHQEGFITPRGSLIGLADEVVEKTQRYSIITSVISGGGSVTGLNLEALVDLSEAHLDQSYVDPDLLTTDYVNQLAVSVRLNDGTPSTHLISETAATDAVTFVTPVADTSQFEAGQIVALGISGLEYRRMIVMGVEPQEGGEIFRITLADERPDLHAT